MPSEASAGSRCILRRGNADSATTAVRASRTLGTSNSQLRIFWAAPGTAGNSKTCSVVVSGNNTPLSVTVTTSAVTINSATNSSGVVTSTVNQIINALYANATFLANWDADTGVGDGTGVIAAAASGNLSGGIAGETFTAIAEVKGARGPSLVAATSEVTSWDSSNGVREFISTLKDSGTMSFTVNYLPGNSGHQALINDLRDGTIKSFELQFGDTRTTTMAFKGIVTGAEITAELEQAISANVSLKLTQWPTWY